MKIHSREERKKTHTQNKCCACICLLRYRCVRVWLGTHLCKQKHTHRHAHSGATGIYRAFWCEPVCMCVSSFRRNSTTKEQRKQNKSNNNADRWKRNRMIKSAYIHIYAKGKKRKKERNKRSGTCRIDWHSNIEFVCDFAWAQVLPYAVSYCVRQRFEFTFPYFSCAFSVARCKLSTAVVAGSCHHCRWNVIFGAHFVIIFVLTPGNEATEIQKN